MTRIVITEPDFRALVRGDVVHGGDLVSPVEIALEGGIEMAALWGAMHDAWHGQLFAQLKARRLGQSQAQAVAD